MKKQRISRLAIMTAMNEEFALLAERYGAGEGVEVAGRRFLRAESGDIELILVSSRIGKVAAASTATILINRFGADAVLFTGVAGGIHRDVQVGDVVVASHLVQHDIDLKGVLGYQRFTIPLLDLSHVPVCENMLEVAYEAALSTAVHARYAEGVGEFVSYAPRVHRGVIASGDTFVSDVVHRRELESAIPDLLCVEMEGAAVAQVCAEHGVPYVVTRIVSDSADDAAHHDFVRFIKEAAAVGSDLLVQEFLSRVQR